MKVLVFVKKAMASAIQFAGKKKALPVPSKCSTVYSVWYMMGYRKASTTAVFRILITPGC